MENKKQSSLKTIILYVVTCLMWFSIYVYVPVLSPYCEDLGMSYTMTGVVLSSYGLIQLICRIPIGILSDLLNKRKIFIIVGLVSSLISNLGFFFVKDPNLLVLFRSLAGLCASTWAIYVTLYLGYFSRSKQTHAMGSISSAMNVGQMLATFSGGLIAMYFTTQLTFAVSGIASIVGLAICLFLPEPNIEKKPIKVRDFYKLLKDKYLIIFSVLAVVLQIGLYASTMGFVPNILKDLGANDFILGLSTTLNTLPAIFSALFAGRFFQKYFGIKFCLILSFLLSAITIVITAFTSSIEIILLMQFLSGFAKGLLITFLTSMAIKNTDINLRSTATAFFQAVYGIGMFIGPILSGFLSDLVDLQFSFIVVGLIVFMAAVVLLMFRKIDYS